MSDSMINGIITRLGDALIIALKQKAGDINQTYV